MTDTDYDSKNKWNNDRKIVSIKTQNDPLFRKLGFLTDEELNALYNLAIALCMPSLDEGFGLPVLEAMNSGCPVISSKFGSLPEVGGKAVYYIDATNSESLVSGFKELSNDNKKRHELIEKGFDQALKFSLKKMIEDTVSVYQKYS